MLDGVVNAIAQVGNTVIVGGRFTRVMEAGGHVLPRTDIFAFDATTGLVEPSLRPHGRKRRGQHALGRARRRVGRFAGGTFDTVNGEPEKRLVKLTWPTARSFPASRPC